MKYYSRLNQYKASNVKFDCETQTAWSYDWWKFYGIINGKKVFNNYSYSNSTSKHQSKVWSHLNYAQDIISIQCPSGLQNNEWKKSSTDHYTDLINELKRAIAKPRSQKKTNSNRYLEIKELEQKINLVHSI